MCLLNESILKRFSDKTERELFEELFQEELLNELATVRAKDYKNIGLLMAVNPSDYIGEPYFKVYDAVQWEKSSKVARISFFEPRLIRHKSDKLPWLSINSKDRKRIVDFLNQKSTITNYSVWDMLKYFWNSEKGIDIGIIDEYLNGDNDGANKNNPDYVPSTLRMPNYLELN